MSEPITAAAGTPTLAGVWVGTLETDEAARFVTARFAWNSDQPTGSINGQTLASLRWDGACLSAQLADLTMTARLDGDTLIGTAQGGSMQERLLMARSFETNPAALGELAGTYALSPEHTISVCAYGEFLFYFDSTTHRTGLLFPKGPDAFWAGPSRLVPLPVRAWATFLRDADRQISGLRWQEAGDDRGIDAPLESPHFTEQTVRFTSGSITLAGTLRIPRTAGPHPAVVLLAGSGPQTRDGFLGMVRWNAEHFSRHGLATLIFDKRGTGASSEADLDNTNLDAFADDALAALRFVQGHPQIDMDRVGLWGISQGTWVAELAAEKSMQTAHDAAFLVLVTGGAVDGTTQEIKRIELTLRADNYSEQEIAQAVRLQTLKFHYANTGEGWEEYQMAYAEAKDAAWWRFLDPPAERDHPAWQWWRVNNAYDPTSVLRGLHCPILAVLAERDTSTPTEISAAHFSEIFGDDPRKRILVFEDANHILFADRTGSTGEAPRITGFVDDYFESMTDWIWQQVRTD